MKRTLVARSGTERVAAALAERLLRPGSTLVLTGAGLSTESGIPDYRSPGRGEYKPMLHHEFVGSAATRQRYWARSALGWATIIQSQPNAGHKMLARLQQSGVVRDIITQNVDGLHLKAGSPAEDLLELHGTLFRATCSNCGATEDRKLLQDRLEAENVEWLKIARTMHGEAGRPTTRPDGDAEPWRRSPGENAPGRAARPDGDSDIPEELSYLDFAAPRCLHCGSDSLKPDVVFFGGSIERDVTRASLEKTDACDRLWVLGTTLTTYSAFRLARYVPRKSRQRKGGKEGREERKGGQKTRFH